MLESLRRLQPEVSRVQLVRYREHRATSIISRILSDAVSVADSYIDNSPSPDWEDVAVEYSDMPAELATDGRKVRLDITGSDWGVQVDSVNGASVTRVVGGAFDGTDCIRIVPPSGSTPNANQTYACILRNLDLTNGGTKNVARATLGFCVKYGSRYFDLGETAKVTGILPSQTIGGSTSAATRAAIYEDYRDLGASDFRRCFMIVCGGVGEFYEPPQGGYQGEHADADLLMLLGSTINHANNPPLVGSEWLYFEQNVDFRQDGSNANGRNRFDVWSRTGYIGYLSVPLTSRADWDFSYQYGNLVEYIGGLWNDPATADANCYLDVSHPIVSVNRTWGQTINPPADF